MFKNLCSILFVIESLLGIAHLFLPEYRWGQNQRAYFNFNEELTAASWLVSMQMVGVAVLALVAFHRERSRQNTGHSYSKWAWLIVAFAALLMSICEISRILPRIGLLGCPHPDVYERFIIFPLWTIFLALFGWSLLSKFRHVPNSYKYGMGWLIAWGLNLCLSILFTSTNPTSGHLDIYITLVLKLSNLAGCTLLLIAMGEYVFGTKNVVFTTGKHGRINQVSFPSGRKRFFIFTGVGGTAFALIFLQIILFRLLTIFGDHVTANSVIAIALIGVGIGGLIGFYTTRRAPLQSMIGASMLLPLSILLVFGTVVTQMDTPLFASILLMLPYILGSVIITVALVQADSYFVYFIDLVGAGIGVLLVGFAFTHLREEGSLLFLVSFTFLIAGCFIISYPSGRTKKYLTGIMLTCLLSSTTVFIMDLHYDWLNVIRTKIDSRFTGAQTLFSRSSLVGRVDVVKRSPGSELLKLYENGRTIDTIRRNPTEDYWIDPRIPHNLINSPDILIIGVAGDGITKTSRSIGKRVYGVEINPVIVDLMKNDLVKFNANSYENIELSVMDGRSFLAQCNRKFDIITLMNAHFERGGNKGRTTSPEYLHTIEAMNIYLDHLTEHGVLILEGPVNRPRKGPHVWKLLVTMRQALLEKGNMRPEQHFFVFQWKTRTNNYIQILMKKTPFTKQEISNLNKWLEEVDNINEIESKLGRRMGPVRTAKTTILHSPDGEFSTNYSRIIKGEVNKDFLKARNLYITTDNKPFLYDVDPTRPGLKKFYTRTVAIMLILIPFPIFFLVRYRSDFQNAFSYMLVVAITGLGFFLIEIVLIQHYKFFLGTPALTFSTVLGTLLIFSGCGSLWSGFIKHKGLYMALTAVLVLLELHFRLTSYIFSFGASFSLPVKVIIAVLSIMPLAFFLGVPFPFVMRSIKQKFTSSSVAMLFAVNGACSALAVSLSLTLSTSLGLKATFQISLLLYIVVGLLLVCMRKRGTQFLANGFAVLAVILLLVCPWILSKPVLDGKDVPGRYRVYGVSYGRSLYQEDKIIYGGSPSKSIPIEWLFWVIQGNGKTILVDTGFDDIAMAKKWNISNYVQPVKRLKQLGILPSEISDIILTHAHWDHIGNLGPFKNAKVWIQESEYKHAKSTINSENIKSKGMRRQDLNNLLSIEEEGRLNIVNGKNEITPGIRLALGAGHTPGSQYVIVNTLDGPVIIAGDACYLYKNNQRHIPVGSSIDPQANLASIKDMHRLAASPFFILPGHDPLVMRWFPKVSDGIVQITSIPE